MEKPTFNESGMESTKSSFGTNEYWKMKFEKLCENSMQELYNNNVGMSPLYKNFNAGKMNFDDFEVFSKTPFENELNNFSFFKNFDSGKMMFDDMKKSYDAFQKNDRKLQQYI